MPANNNEKSNESRYGRFKNLWGNAPWLQLKKEQRLFYNMVLAHTTATEQKVLPQVLQGMWQAYGQMRAARTLAWGAVMTTGVLGVGLWGYQQVLSREKNTNDRQEEELIKNKKAHLVEVALFEEKKLSVRKLQDTIMKLNVMREAKDSELQVADDEIKKAYNGNDNDVRYQQYKSARNKASEKIFDNVKKKLGIMDDVINENGNNSSRPTR